jgi:hypothetical protein
MMYAIKRFFPTRQIMFSQPADARNGEAEMSDPEGRDDLISLLYFSRALGVALLALITLAVTAAMLWKDVGLESFFDRWFGNWPEWQLSALAAGMIILSLMALRATQRSHARYRARRIIK